MRVILVNTDFMHDTERPIQPLTMYTIAGIITPYVEEVEVIEPMKYRLYPENGKLIDVLIAKSKVADLIAFTTNSFSWAEILRLTLTIRENNKQIKIVVGGIHVSYFYREILKENPQIDFALMEDIKINGNDYFNNKFVEKSYKRYEYDYMNYTRISGKFLSLDGIVSAIFQVITFLYGGWQTLDGKMSVGELTVICTYFSSSLQIIKYYFEFGKSYQNVKTSLNRLKELWSIECEKDGNKVINSIAKVDGLISFGYSKNKKILDDFVVKLEKGKIYGVVGQNGSGKSTLSKLLIGLLHTNSIHINDIDISNVNMKLLRLNNLLYIPQTLNYPNRTIQEIYQECTDNINIETLINNIKKIHLSRESNIINLLRNNWEHNINKLSGGEKQIISILKTMVKKFDFVILDEPSSNLDSNRATVLTEILEYLKKEEKIILIITHDLNIENKCDIKLHLTKLEERSDIQSINTNI